MTFLNAAERTNVLALLGETEADEIFRSVFSHLGCASASAALTRIDLL